MLPSCVFHVLVRNFWADGIEALIEYNRKLELSVTHASQQNSEKVRPHKRGPSLSFNLLGSHSRKHSPAVANEDDDLPDENPEHIRAGSNLQVRGELMFFPFHFMNPTFNHESFELAQSPQWSDLTDYPQSQVTNSIMISEYTVTFSTWIK